MPNTTGKSLTSRWPQKQLKEESYIPKYKLSKLLTCTIYILNIPITCVIDSGSTASILLKEVFEKLKAAGAKTKMTKQPTAFTLAANNNIFSLGTVEIVFRFGKSTYKNLFHVMKNLSNPIIIGIDFFTQV